MSSSLNNSNLNNHEEKIDVVSLDGVDSVNEFRLGQLSKVEEDKAESVLFSPSILSSLKSNPKKPPKSSSKFSIDKVISNLTNNNLNKEKQQQQQVTSIKNSKVTESSGGAGFTPIEKPKMPPQQQQSAQNSQQSMPSQLLTNRPKKPMPPRPEMSQSGSATTHNSNPSSSLNPSMSKKPKLSPDSSQTQSANRGRLTPSPVPKSNFPPILTSSRPVTSPTPPFLHQGQRNGDAQKSNNSSGSMTIVGTVVNVTSNQVWICPSCNKPENSRPMIGCDSCDDWYHW